LYRWTVHGIPGRQDGRSGGRRLRHSDLLVQEIAYGPPEFWRRDEIVRCEASTSVELSALEAGSATSHPPGMCILPAFAPICVARCRTQKEIAVQPRPSLLYFRLDSTLPCSSPPDVSAAHPHRQADSHRPRRFLLPSGRRCSLESSSRAR